MEPRVPESHDLREQQENVTMPEPKTDPQRSIPRILTLAICFCMVLFSSVLLGQPRGCLGVLWRDLMSKVPSDHTCSRCSRPATGFASYEQGRILWLCDSCEAPGSIKRSSGDIRDGASAPINWIILALPIIIHIVGFIFFGYLLNEAIYSPAMAGQPMGHGAEGFTLLVVLAVAGNFFCYFFVGR
jgi:hypothetical protein